MPCPATELGGIMPFIGLRLSRNAKHAHKKKRLAAFAASPFTFRQRNYILPMSASMTCSATTMEAATTAAHRTAATMEAVPAADFISSASSTTEPFVTMESVIEVPVMIPTTAMVPIATAIVAATIKRTPIESMEPRAGADEYSVHEVISAPITIRRASIRSIRVVAVSANRRCSDRYAYRTNADSHSYLRARHCAHRERQNSNHCRISNIL